MQITYSDDCPREDIDFFLNEWKNELPYFTTQTSGSTGAPKQIRTLKEHAKASAKATIDFLNLKKGDKALMSLNPNTIGGKMMLIRAYEHSLNIHCIRPQGNPLKDITETFDFVSMAPLQLANVLEENPSKMKFAKNTIIGGGIISDKYIQKLEENDLTVFQTFGMTETISHIALRKVGKESEEFYQTINGITVSQNEVDKSLIIHAPKLGLEELHSNDIIELLNPTMFKWKGRTDYTINSGGVKVQIEELEKQLSKLIQQPFFIWSSPHDKLGQQIVLIVEGEIQKEWLTKDFYSNINLYHIPKRIGNIELILRTNSDKILRASSYEIVNKKDGFKSIL